MFQFFWNFPCIYQLHIFGWIVNSMPHVALKSPLRNERVYHSPSLIRLDTSPRNSGSHFMNFSTQGRLGFGSGTTYILDVSVVFFRSWHDSLPWWNFLFYAPFLVFLHIFVHDRGRVLMDIPFHHFWGWKHGSRYCTLDFYLYKDSTH